MLDRVQRLADDLPAERCGFLTSICRVEKRITVSLQHMYLLQVAMLWWHTTTVSAKLSIDVVQAGWHRMSTWHAEAEPHSLANIVVGVLAKDDDSHTVNWTAVHCPANS